MSLVEIVDGKVVINLPEDLSRWKTRPEEEAMPEETLTAAAPEQNPDAVDEQERLRFELELFGLGACAWRTSQLPKSAGG